MPRWPALMRAATVVAAVALAVLLPARPAAAHAVLAGSDPANGASLTRVPGVVVLRFSEDLAPTATTARLMDAAGTAVPGAHPVPSLAGRRELRLRVPPLVAGSYAVVWQVAGVSDGHPTSGVLVFTVERGATQAAGAPGGGAFEAIVRWLRLVLLAGLVGGLALAGVVLAPAATGDPDRLLVEMAQPVRRRVLAVAAVCAAGAGCLALVDLATGPLQSWRVGQLAAVTVAGPLLLLLRQALTRPGRYPLRVAWVTVAALAAGACVLEAGGEAANGWLAFGGSALQALTGCLVLGLAGMLGVLLWRPGLTAVRRGAVLRSCRRPLVRVMAAGAALGTAAVLYGAGRQLDSVGQLPHTLRGRLLLAQAALMLLGCLLGLAGAARIYRWGRPTAFVHRLPTRPLLAAALACCLALFGTGVAAAAAEPAQAATAAPAIGDGRLDDLLVSVSVVPNRPGPNGFTVEVASSRRPAPAPVDQVALTYPAEGGSAAVALADVGSGRFFGTATLGPAGIADLVVVVHRSGANLSVPVPWSAPVGAVAPPTGGLGRWLRVPVAVLFTIVFGLGVWWLLPSPVRWRADV